MAEKIVKKVVIEVDDKGTLKRTSKDTRTLNRNMKGLSKQSSNASKNFSKTAQGMQGVLVPAYAEVAARVFALTAVYQALTRASDFRILMQGQAEYAKRTGKNMADISRQVQKAAKGMLDFQSAASAVALATTSGISSSQIVAMTKAAVDSSTALGRSVTDTMDRLTRGIVKAEPEILDEIGVIIRLDQVYKDYALSVKKSTTELTEGEKATARYNAIMLQLEQKFGGIAEKVDPNYIRASAAATMDILAQAGAKLIGIINPIFKFLSEVKSAIVVILLLIIKTLAGKIFPVFESFGKRIAAYPKKMGLNIKNLTEKIQKMNAEIIKARNLSGTAGQALDRANVAGFRGKAYKAGATTKPQAMTNLRSMRATNVLMSKALGDRDKATYKGLTITRKMYQKRIEDEMRLRSEIGKTHKASEVFWKRASVQATKFNLVLQKTKMIWGSAAKSAAQYFTRTKQLMADRGMVMGMIGAVKILQRQWRIAGVQVSIYQKLLKGATAATAVLGIVSAVLGAIISKAFAWIMALTLILSLGKMILDIFVDFDTPFKRAADAVRELNSKLKEQSILLSQKDKLINFEGAAESFDQAMANATFAENFSTSLYDATSDAMKALAAEMGEAGWWEGAFDWVKGWVGMSSFDNMQEALGTQIDMIMKTYPHIEQKMRGSVDKHGNSIYGVGGRASRDDYMDERYQQWKSGRTSGQFNNRNYWETYDSYEGKGGTMDYANALATDTRAFTMQDWIEGLTGSLKGLSEELQRPMLIAAFEDLKTRIKEQSKLDRARTADIKAMNDAFETLSKAENKYTETLLIKTAVHDMAVQQRNVQKIMADDNILDSTKIFALQAREMLPEFKTSTNYWEMKLAQDANKETPGTWSQEHIAKYATAYYKDIEKQIPKIVGGIKDWAAIELDLTKNITERLVQQHMLMVNDLYGGESTKTAQAYHQKVIDLMQIKQDKQIYNIALGEANLALELDQLKMEQQRWVIWNKMSKMYLGQTRSQDKYQLGLKQSGSKETIAGKYGADLEDAASNYKELLANAMLKGTNEKEVAEYLSSYVMAESRILSEMALAYTRDANKLMNNIAVSSKSVREHVDAVIATLSATDGITAYIERMSEAGMGKYLDLEKVSPYYLIKMMEGSKEEKALPGKIKATALVLKNLEIEDKHIKEHKILLEHRKKIAEIEMNVQGEYAQNVQKHLRGLEDIAKLQREVNKLELAESLKMVKDTMATIASAFGSAVTQAFNDMFEGNDKSFWDTIKAGVGKGMTSAAATNLGSMAQKAAFGNKGIVASLWRTLPGGIGAMADDVFPRTQLEVARDSLTALQTLVKMQEAQMLPGQLAIFKKLGGGPSANTGGGIDWATVIGWVVSAFGGGGGGGRNMQGSHGYQMAMGGVAPGGFRAFAHGGIANRPTLGMIGEGRYNEAVVPLPDGKSIPVIGGGGNNVTVNVAVDANGQSAATEVSGSGARELGYRVSQAVQQELVAQQRPGGLLSSY